MHRIAFRVAIALFTFTIGTVAALLWVVPHFQSIGRPSSEVQQSGNVRALPKQYCPDSRKPSQRQREATLSGARTTSWRASMMRMSGGETLSAIQFLSNDEGWIGGEGGTLYKTSDGGKSWRRIKLNLLTDSEIVGISFVSPLLGWVIVQKPAPVVTSYGETHCWLMQTSDGGQTWQLLYEAKEAEIAEASFVNEQEGWLVGVKYVGLGPLRRTLLVLHTTDQGRHWSDLSGKLKGRNNDDNNGVASIHAIGPNSAVLLDYYHQLLRTDNGGESWAQVLTFPEEPPQSYMSRFDFLSNGRLWAVGGADSIEGIWGTLALMDSDCSWTLNTLGGVWFIDAVFLSDKQVLACGSISTAGHEMDFRRRDGLILESIDAGASWMVVFRDARIPRIYSMAKADSKNVWAVGANGYVLHLQPLT